MENKEEKFKRLEEARLRKAIKSIELLENLAGPAYTCSKTDAKAMIDELNDAVNKLAAVFGVAVQHTPQKVVDTFHPMPLNESYARWAFDKLQAGRTKDGIEMLRKALKDC